MSASAIKMGGVFVEIGADPKKFFAALTRVNKSIASMGKSLVSGGTKVTAAGVGMAAPIVAAVRQGARFESVLLGIRASTGATAAEIDKIKTASLQMSQALGVGPTEAAGGMLELLKAGMSLEAVLGGAGQAALQFAKVGDMAVAEAAVVMADAMNVFSVDAATAANTISSAADASSTDIHNLSIAFSQVSAVAGLANQSIHDTAAALAVMANAGVKGSDAGTSLKTMLLRLMAPTEESAKALASIGLSTDSFRGADGKILPLVDVIGTLQKAMQGVDQATADNIFRDVFGQDAIRAAAILTQTGVDGFQGMRDAMAQALPVGEKFKVMMSGMAGAGSRLVAGLERLAIAVSGAVGPALSAAIPYFEGFIAGLESLIPGNEQTVQAFAKLAAAAMLVGGALTGAGFVFQAVSFGLGGVVQAAKLVIVPLVSIAASAISVAASFGTALVGVVAYGATSIATAVATAAAWGLANIPLAALLGILIAIGGMAAGVLMGVASGANDVADAMDNGMRKAVEEASAAFSNLKEIGTSVMDAIVQSILAGDLEGAMKVAMEGLNAAFTVGVNSLQDTIKDIPFIRFLGPTKYKLRVFGNSTEGDAAGVQQRKAQTDDAMSAVRQAVSVQRERLVRRQQGKDVLSGVGSATTMEQLFALSQEFMALRDNNRLSLQEQSKINDAIDAAAERITEANSGKPVPAAVAVERTSRMPTEDIATLMSQISGATTLGQLGKAGQKIGKLIDMDSLTAEQEQALIDSYRDTQNRIAEADRIDRETKRQRDGVQAVGTFSSLNLGAAFGGTSVAERTAKAAEDTARGVRELVNQGGPRAAA